MKEYRVYVVHQRKGLFDEGLYDWESYFYPAMSVEEINREIVRLDEEGEREFVRGEWIWRMREEGVYVSKRLEIVHNKTNCLMSPEIWLRHNLESKGFNLL